jgi:hypothetical protein
VGFLFCFVLAVVGIELMACAKHSIPLSYVSSPFCFSYFSDRVSCLLSRTGLGPTPASHIIEIVGKYHHTWLVLLRQNFTNCFAQTDLEVWSFYLYFQCSWDYRLNNCTQPCVYFCSGIILGFHFQKTNSTYKSWKWNRLELLLFSVINFQVKQIILEPTICIRKDVL